MRLWYELIGLWYEVHGNITIVITLQRQYISNSILDLNWTWIGLELELLLPYIGKFRNKDMVLLTHFSFGKKSKS